MASVITAASCAMRCPSQAGTRPVCRGRSALPARRAAMESPHERIGACLYHALPASATRAETGRTSEDAVIGAALDRRGRRQREASSVYGSSGVKIATFNGNGVNGRLPVLLRWLEQSAPDVVCLQELKASDEKFPADAIRKAGYGAIWHGQKSWNGVAILTRDVEPTETRRGLPGDPDDAQSRYIEAAVNGILVGCIYLPNGNPAPGPKFDYKLRWFERLISHAASCS